MTTDITALVEDWRKAMEGVTPGPWEVAVEGTFPSDEGDKVLGPQGTNSLGYPVRYYVAQFVLGGNAAWIARCSPDAISALLDAIEAAEEDARAYAEAAKGQRLWKEEAERNLERMRASRYRWVGHFFEAKAAAERATMSVIEAAELATFREAVSHVSGSDVSAAMIGDIAVISRRQLERLRQDATQSGVEPAVDEDFSA